MGHELPIALWKGTQSRNHNPIYACVSNYDIQSTSYVSFVSALDYVSIPKSIGETLNDANWHQATLEEIATLHSYNSWDIIPLTLEKNYGGLTTGLYNESWAKWSYWSF